MESLSPQTVLEPASGSAVEAETLAVLHQRIAEKQPAAKELAGVGEFMGRAAKLVISDREQQLADERREAMEQTAIERRKQANIDALVRGAGEGYIGCRLNNYRVSHPQQTKVVDALQDYIASIQEHVAAGRGIILYGPVGTGKDHLLFAMARAVMLLMKDFTIAWHNGQDWFGEVRDAMDSGVAETKTIRQLSQPDLLVLSDPLPPTGNLSPHMATMLYRAIDDRYSRNRITFVSVNVANDDEADSRMGAPTWDRLCDGAFKLHCAWPSYRKPFRVE